MPFGSYVVISFGHVGVGRRVSNKFDMHVSIVEG